MIRAAVADSVQVCRMEWEEKMSQTADRSERKAEDKDPWKLIEVTSLFRLDETIAAEVLSGVRYPWEALPKIHDFILRLGTSLPEDVFVQRGEQVWVAKTAQIADSACIQGPAIIDEGAEIRHCAFIRGNAIVGKGAVVGNSTELKNVILFNQVQVPHYNYVGDSILGFRSHMGAGAVTSNVKSDKTPVTVTVGTQKIPTGLKKCGAMLGDEVEVGCGSVLNPGTIAARRVSVYPLSSVRGFVPEDCIYKQKEEIVVRQ